MLKFDPDTTTTDNSTTLEAVWMWQNDADDVSFISEVILNSDIDPSRFTAMRM